MLTHIEHIEDAILTGDLRPLDVFTEWHHLSVKMDGAPAIVWGTHPETERFFVGTKSVFNKKKIKINYTHDDINNNHEGNVALILHACLANLPRTSGIIQGDFIGFGGDDTYCPNTVTYVFDDIIQETIVVAPHTWHEPDQWYDGDGNCLRECMALPLNHGDVESTDECLFVRPKTWKIVDDDFSSDVAFARQMAQMVRFVDDKQAAKLKQVLNSFIREGIELDEEVIAYSADCDVNLIRLWKLVRSMKHEYLFACRNNGPKAYLNNRRCHGEGYVVFHDYGTFKFVKRENFSRLNFTMQKAWDS